MQNVVDGTWDKPQSLPLTRLQSGRARQTYTPALAQRHKYHGSSVADSFSGSGDDDSLENFHRAGAFSMESGRNEA